MCVVSPCSGHFHGPCRLSRSSGSVTLVARLFYLGNVAPPKSDTHSSLSALASSSLTRKALCQPDDNAPLDLHVIA